MKQVVRAIAASQHRRWSGFARSRFASPPFGDHRTIAGDLLMLAVLFAFIFGLPGLFAGV